MNNASDTTSKQTLLIVDDEPMNIKLLQTLFKDDYRITAATNGESALEICQRAPPDLILLDVMMPEVDGYTVLKRLKQCTTTADIAVLFVSAKLGEDEENLGLNLGALDYVAKPINPIAVKAKVRNHMLAIRQRKFIESLAKEQAENLAQKEIDSQNQQVEHEANISNYLQKLKSERERLRAALWGSGNELWDWNLVTGQIERQGSVNDFNLPRECQLGDIDTDNFYQFFSTFIHPADIDAYQTGLAQVLTGVTDVFSFDYRIKNSYGEWTWVQDNGRVISRDNMGNVIRMAGTIQNIQARKEAEQQRRIIASAFQNTSDGVWITDEKFNIQLVNKAFLSITASKEQDVIGKQIAFPNCKGQDAGFINRIQKELKETGKWTGEVWAERNNEFYPQELRVVSVENQENGKMQYAGIFTDITYRKRAEEELIKLANYDSLTQLPNRTLFYERLNKSIISQRDKLAQLGIIFIDLDNFKKINDTLGHSAGDTLLKQVAERLANISRDQDTVARLGGDEFIMLVEPVISNHIIAKISQRIVACLSNPFRLGSNEVTVTPSLGIASYPEDGRSSEDLIKNADIAMYEAKASGKATFRFYTDSMNKDALERLQLEADLRSAITNKEIFLHFQPKVIAQTGAIKGLEVLARWERKGHMVRPDIFINIAEETGMMPSLGTLILTQACTHYQKWVEKGLAHGRVAVNVSTQQFNSDDFIATVQSVLQQTGLAPQYLELEITETAVIGDTEKAIRHMHALRELGVHLAMDDFGTGYSSLSYLKQFPINTLKIDQSFVREMLSDKRSKTIVELIINIAHTLNLDVVAEGVELEEQACVIKQLEGEQLQGYLFSKPITAEEYEKFILAHHIAPENSELK